MTMTGLSLDKIGRDEAGPDKGGIGPPSARAVLSWPLPDLGLLDRTLARGVSLITRRCVLSIEGLEHIAPGRDPFILALNHGTRLEALLVPPFLFLLRHGERIHFMADWNFRLVPLIDLLYRRAGVITVTRKPARPRFLNVLKPLFTSAIPPAEQARQLLVAGRSVGVFPEGTVNRDSLRLRRGRPGAAQLSLETGVPVVPVGLRYPAVPRGAAVPEGSPMAIDIGAPMVPPAAGKPTYAAIWAWHGQIMTAIARLSGKSWDFSTQDVGKQEAGNQEASRQEAEP
jgi:1-acyl-sn-glycerol-3-phosphate acyltransferase